MYGSSDWVAEHREYEEKLEKLLRKCRLYIATDTPKDIEQAETKGALLTELCALDL
jgi:hypothetical protein